MNKKNTAKAKAAPKPKARAKAKAATTATPTNTVPKKTAAKPRPRKAETKERERLRRLGITRTICDKYAESSESMSSICEANGVDRATFWRWRDEDPELQALFDEARTRHDKLYFETIGESALGSMRKLVEGYEYEETQQIAKVIVVDGQQKVVPDKVVKTKHHVPPSPGMVAMTLRNLHGWRDRLDIKHSGEIVTAKQVMIIGGKEIEF